jgi:hypothetical protein
MLNSAVVSAWIWVHIGILLVVVAYATCGHALFPTLVERGRERLSRSLPATLAIGLAIGVPIVGVALFMLTKGPTGPVKVAGAAIGLGFLATALLGLAPLALHIGARGDANPNARQARWTTVARGAAIIALTWMLPVVGWLVALPLSLACGAGCIVLSLASRPSTNAVAA